MQRSQIDLAWWPLRKDTSSIPELMDGLNATEPCGCHLQAIWGCARYDDGFRKDFDDLLHRKHGKGDGYKGQYITGTIVSVKHSERIIEELKKRGFKLLGTQPGAHPEHYDGAYDMELWGLGFTLPGEKEK